MAVVLDFMDGFDHYDDITYKWDADSVGTIIETPSSDGIATGQCLFLNEGTGDGAFITHTTQRQIHISFRARRDTGGWLGFSFYNKVDGDYIAQQTFRFNTDGSISAFGGTFDEFPGGDSFTLWLPANTWKYFRLICHSSMPYTIPPATSANKNQSTLILCTETSVSFSGGFGHSPSTGIDDPSVLGGYPKFGARNAGEWIDHERIGVFGEGGYIDDVRIEYLDPIPYTSHGPATIPSQADKMHVYPLYPVATAFGTVDVTAVNSFMLDPGDAGTGPATFYFDTSALRVLTSRNDPIDEDSPPTRVSYAPLANQINMYVHSGTPQGRIQQGENIILDVTARTFDRERVYVFASRIPFIKVNAEDATKRNIITPTDLEYTQFGIATSGSVGQIVVEVAYLLDDITSKGYMNPYLLIY